MAGRARKDLRNGIHPMPTRSAASRNHPKTETRNDMKTDQQLRDDIMAELAWDPSIGAVIDEMVVAD